MAVTIFGLIDRRKKIIRLECDFVVNDYGKITEKKIKEIVEKDLKSQKELINYKNLTSLIDEITDDILNLYKIENGDIVGLTDDSDHLPWLENRDDLIKGQYFEIYRKYLKEEENFSEAAINDIDRSTHKILSKLENPEDSSRSWDRRGVIIGSVQSGKTANFIGLINRARDHGYKFIVILSGANNDLRQQTQERVDEGYIGYYTTNYSRPDNAKVSTPLGLERSRQFPKTQSYPIYGTYNEIRGDFLDEGLKRLTKQPIKKDSDISYVFVIKKNKKPLTNLISWITQLPQRIQGGQGYEKIPEKNTKDPPFIKDFPILVLDDECDHYSVDTGERPKKDDGTFDEEYSPKTINALIRKLLCCFSRRAYVGYTATPFANIFIHSQAATKKHGPDLFPKSFMFDIRPPSNHQGLENLFAPPDEDDPSQTSDESHFIVPIKDFCSDPSDFNCKTGWIPYKHGKHHIPRFDPDKDLKSDDYNLLDEKTLDFYLEILAFSSANSKETVQLPPSLIHAVMSFIITSAARNVRHYDQIFNHKSMLIHVTKFINVQGLIVLELEKLMNSILDILRYKKDHFFSCVKHIWENYYLKYTKEYSDPNKHTITFDQLKNNETRIEWIIREIKKNIFRMSGGGNKPNYKKYKKENKVGLTTIIVGGDKLSRGVTFDGLSISYFLRASKMYDTLMQMGRWFGFRKGYEDLCRLYTSTELRQNFIDINIASEDLRNRVSYMAEHNRTPKDFGLAVIRSPGLLITSKVKMRDGLERNNTFSGQGTQMTTLPWNIDSIKKNYELTFNLINSLGKEDEGPTIKRNWGKEQSSIAENSYIWKNKSHETVLNFVRSFKEHKNSNFDCEAQSKYIKECVNQNFLTNWNIMLIGNGNSKMEWDVGGKRVFLTERKPLSESSSKEEKAAFGAVWNPEHERYDIENEDYMDAVLKSQYDKKKVDRDTKVKFTQEIRRKRPESRGILLIYPLVPILYETTINTVNEPVGGNYTENIWKPFKKNFLRMKKNIQDINDRKPLISIAISYPEITKDVTVPYTVNNVYYDQEHSHL